MTENLYEKFGIRLSHVMGKEECEIRCPGDTPRFYGVTRCIKCGYEILQHPAGKFVDHELTDFECEVE